MGSALHGRSRLLQRVLLTGNRLDRAAPLSWLPRHCFCITFVGLLIGYLAFGWMPRALDAAEVDATSEEFFEKKIRPVLSGTCFRCHGGQATVPGGAGGLRVDARDALMQGGESGAAIEPGNAQASLLVRAIRRDAEVSAMPPDRSLAPEEVSAIEQWIQAGAPWPAQSEPFAHESHWAFQPIRNVEPPHVQRIDWVRHPIDAFILANLEDAGQPPSVAAAPRDWLRRVTYDLTGLPATAEEIAAFEQETGSIGFEAATQSAVERLLQSPRYGEQWGRHWLDIVRYADTAGENSDHPLPHAWRYRNWVIQAINQDMPYDEFIRQQVAGDLFAQKGPPDQFADQVIATGYLAIARRFGHDIDQDMHLTLEDSIDTLGKSILGLTLGCARCHDHKFDPLSMRDYYGLYGILSSTRFAFPGCEPKQQPRDLVPLLPASELAERIEPLQRNIQQIDDELKRLSEQRTARSKELLPLLIAHAHTLAEGAFDDGGESRFGDETSDRSDQVANQNQNANRQSQSPLYCELKAGEAIQLTIDPKADYGADTTQLELEVRWIPDSDSQGASSSSPLFGSTAERNSWRLQEIADNPQTQNPQIDSEGAPTWAFLDIRDGAKLLPDYLKGLQGHADLHVWRQGDNPSVVVNASDEAIKAWTKIDARSVVVHPAPDGPVVIQWFAPRDGRYHVQGHIRDAHAGGGNGIQWKLEHIGSAEWLRAMKESLQGLQQQSELVERRRQLAAQATVPVAYAVADGSVADARLHVRGNPSDLGEEVPRKFLDLLGGQIVSQKSESGRRELAQWLTSPENCLTARVIVNRVWHWHFGRGLVKTPNDFGTRGAPPTHPELLDYLAYQFMQNGWSLKWLHRQILGSATYSQACITGSATTPSDDLYAFFPRRRLSAEELRDTLLHVTGELDLKPGENHPFPPEASWSFSQHAPFAAEYESNKRSVYLMQKRNRRTRFFALFDGADPNASTPVRDTTMVPTQALFFMNDPFLHGRAETLADQLTAISDENTAIDSAYERILSRRPTTAERQDARDLIAQFPSLPTDAGPDVVGRRAWSALVRVLFASNEFLFVD